MIFGQPSTNDVGQVTQNYCSLTPAYGRDYKSLKEVHTDFNDNKDFVMEPSGQYINREQFAKGVTVNIRYSQLRKVASVKVK